MSRAAIYWFTGLSGSGKTTVATAVKSKLEKQGLSVLILDGDHIRKKSHPKLTFTERDIKQNNMLIAELCQKYRENRDVILVAIISPYKSSRKMAREMLGESFYEVYFSADIEIVSERDVKGLYAKASSGKIDNLIGFSPGSIYEAPTHPDCTVNSGVESVVESVELLHEFIVKCLDILNDSQY